jgi:hypothetical protein
MLVLLHYDALNNPVANSSTNRNKDFSTYLDKHPYEEFTDDDLTTVRYQIMDSNFMYFLFSRLVHYSNQK